MFFNDRRQAKKAASATTKAQIAAMAKQGTLRATTTNPGQREFGRAERAAVHEEVSNVEKQFGPPAGTNTSNRASRFASATRKINKAEDVNGFDGPAYRKRSAESDKSGKQPKRYLPKKAGK